MCILKAPYLKIRNRHSIQGSLARASQALIWNFSICIVDMVKDQLGLFLFLKTWKYPSASTKEQNCVTYQFTVGILCLTMRPWDSSQKRESHGKTVEHGRSIRKATGNSLMMSKFSSSLTKAYQFLKKTWIFMIAMLISTFRHQ